MQVDVFLQSVCHFLWFPLGLNLVDSMDTLLGCGFRAFCFLFFFS